MKFDSTVIFVRDIEKSKNFYLQYLGFSIEHDFGKNIIFSEGLTIWEIQPDHLINKQLKTDNDSNRFELYFEDNDIDKICNALEDAGISFLHKLHEEPWGQRTIRFFDPDNHLIEIGEPLPVFVRNMSNRGMTVSEISAKSGIPVKTVEELIESK